MNQEVSGQDEDGVDENRAPHDYERQHENQESAEELHILAGDVVLKRITN